MKIVQVVPTFLPYQSGMTSVAYYLSLGLRRHGHEVTVITPDYHNDIGSTPDLPFTVKRLKPLFSYGNAAFLPNIIKELKNFDVVHLHYPFFGVAELIWLFRKFIPGKIVLHYHNDVVINKSLMGRFFSFHLRHITPRIAGACDQVIFLQSSQVESSALKKAVLQNKIRYSILPNGVDLNIFRPFSIDRNLFSRYNLSADSRIFLFVGGMSTAYFFKGVESLLRATASLVRNEGQNKLILLLVGDGERRLGYEKLADELGIKNNVRFLGWQNQADLAKLYNMSEVLILPSLSESFPVVLLEAFACAKPVVVSDLPSIRMLVKDGENGFLINPGDVDDLAVKMQKISDNPEHAKAMGQRGLLLVRQSYSWEQIVDELEKIYISLC